jgi:hypothetical protein
VTTADASRPSWNVRGSHAAHDRLDLMPAAESGSNDRVANVLEEHFGELVGRLAADTRISVGPIGVELADLGSALMEPDSREVVAAQAREVARRSVVCRSLGRTVAGRANDPTELAWSNSKAHTPATSTRTRPRTALEKLGIAIGNCPCPPLIERTLSRKVRRARLTERPHATRGRHAADKAFPSGITQAPA